MALVLGGAVRAPAFGETRSSTISCDHTIRPFRQGTRLQDPWSVGSPRDDTTYDLTHVTSTAYPSESHPDLSVFSLGSDNAGARTCFDGGVLNGSVSDRHTWEYYHNNYNAACLRIVATRWMRVSDLKCDGVEDGLRPKETHTNANNVRLLVTGTYFDNVRDDCLENDGVIGGLLRDNLWQRCNTGISEQPSSSTGDFTSPAREKLILDHMLIGLYKTPHSEGLGESELFKWSSSANKVVIKCSIFQVDDVSLNGTDSMKIPAGTDVDDSACRRHPSTIVWLGRGRYPAATRGLRVTHHIREWDRAVTEWRYAHGYGGCRSRATSA